MTTLFEFQPPPFEEELRWISSRACVEHWDIFEAFHCCPHEGDECSCTRFEIQYDQDYPWRWPNGDEGVWWHVWRKAEEGSELHLRALFFIQMHSPEEFALIARYIIDRNHPVRHVYDALGEMEKRP